MERKNDYRKDYSRCEKNRSQSSTSHGKTGGEARGKTGSKKSRGNAEIGSEKT